jgi:REP element-mobilizing transposase RayT
MKISRSFLYQFHILFQTRHSLTEDVPEHNMDAVQMESHQKPTQLVQIVILRNHNHSLIILRNRNPLADVQAPNTVAARII